MSDTVISLKGLSKRYLVGHQHAQTERYTALRDVIVQGASNLVRKTVDMVRGRPIVQGDEVEEFWALKDVSFDIKQGDRVGIIGRNGAGKSTLLKILSRITEPTAGEVRIKGRVASLLEVGTGFHPELTGRENIFLNGAILGMKRSEILRKFDEIVDFAEVEKFLDTPVKRYSSGMYVRLAFAVAAHLEPEVLLIDEVLAVGDIHFQKRCLGKMQQIGESGRTVIFVSHNMSAITALCNVGVLLEKGELTLVGTPQDATTKYQREATVDWISANRNTNAPHIIDIYLTDSENQRKLIFEHQEKCFLNIEIFTAHKRDIRFGFTLINAEEIGIFSGISTDSIDDIPEELCTFIVKLPIDLLNPGAYRLEGALADAHETFEQSDCFVKFQYYRNTPFDIQGHKSKGMLRIPSEWQLTTTKST